MAYNAYDGKGDALTYKLIERFVKIAKTHRNIADQDKAFVEKAWKEAVLNLDENWPFNEVTTVDIILMIIDVSHLIRYYSIFFCDGWAIIIFT